ncbi:MarP family serine protease [Stackebrandtia nassauensis]|uniref:Colicin V production protein n=1 Tax=Stackebrandtia nassauensis (strain DSM 44728 / CIP 108903 / NRRL B-16338 / NBRC 102104 / LLR-40K-21) TaxID=446470 RepID=D3QA66_STANL|nr:MarP family serine protease [Stackebrandtia nassauensis]ADD40778.1 Colicin V production protein [Stackebrandtia nassauensis DSM 44728]
MQGGILVDIVIVLLALLFAINGYRQGFIIGALGFAGFFGGALIGVQIAPLLVEVSEAPAARVLIALLVVFGIAMLGQWGGSALGVRLRKRVKNDNAKRFDEFGGALVSMVAVLLVAWVVAAPLASSGMPGLAAAVRNSAIVRTIDENMPGPAQNVYNALRSAVNTNGFPEVFSGLDPSDSPPVDPPDPELANSKVVRDAEASVLRVSGDAPQCDRHIEGSSFVYDADRDLVLTNAHVVAGTESVSVAGADGDVEARVVVFDDRRDLAVLYAPGLNAPELDTLDEAAESGADTIVLGYPQGGPYTATASRVREHREVTGPDIYDSGEVTREVYSLRSQVRSGNSGGPLISADGDVYGVIFAAAVDDPDTGYAVTMDEARPIMEEGQTTTESVSTKGCT